MITRIISLAIGGAITWLALWLTKATTGDAYVVPIVIGAVGAFFWPVVIGFVMVRRARERQEARIQSEVERQMNQQGRGR